MRQVWEPEALVGAWTLMDNGRRLAASQQQGWAHLGSALLCAAAQVLRTGGTLSTWPGPGPRRRCRLRCRTSQGAAGRLRWL
jgi:hypothetical protein